MSRDQTGQPGNENNQQEQTGIPGNLQPENQDADQAQTDKYTNDDNEVADHVRVINPNRNVDKEDATNAGGYRN